MARIATIETGFYRIPLPVTLSDSTHGEIAAFELITCRIRDADGAEGAGLRIVACQPLSLVDQRMAVGKVPGQTKPPGFRRQIRNTIRHADLTCGAARCFIAVGAM